MHAGITAIIALAVKSGLTSRSPCYEIITKQSQKKPGWSLGWVSAFDVEGRTIWIVDAHRGYGKRFIVRAEEMLTAFTELQRAIREFAVSLIS